MDAGLWDGVAGDYEAHSYGGEDGKYPANRFRAELVLEYMEGQSGRVLDAGCGTAYVGRQLLSDGFDVVCADYSEGMLCEASANPECGFVRCDVKQLPFQDDSFDYVMMLGVLPYVREDEGVYRGVHRVLRGGGVFIAAQYNREFMELLEDGGRVERVREALEAAGVDSSYAGSFNVGSETGHTMKFEDAAGYGEKIRSYGFIQERLYYYNFHVRPPGHHRPEDAAVRSDLERRLHDSKLGKTLAKTFLSVSRKV